MKLYRAFLFVVMAALLLSACAGQATPAPSAATEAPAQPTEAPAQPTTAAETGTQPEPTEAPPAEPTTAPSGGEATSGGETVLTIGIPGDVETLDPSFGAAERANEVIKNVYDQPVRYARQETPDGYSIADVTQFEGVVWESFELQPDNVTYKIKVRPGMKFIDSGEEITAETIKYKFERAFGVATSDLWVANTAGVTSLDQVQVDGKYDLTIKLEEPNPLFLPLMRDQDFGIVDPTAIEANATADDPWATAWMAKNAASSGEYYVESWTPGVEMVLRANPDYWAGPACIDKVVLKIIPESANRALLLGQGAIDIAANLSVDEIESLRGTPGVQILSIPSRNQVMLGMNNTMAPFDNVKVRQALAYAVPYEQILESVYHGQGALPQGSWPQRAQFFDPSSWNYTYDPETAKSLLQEAGVADGLSFTLAIPTGDSEMEAVAVILQNAFREIGVTMEIDKQAAAVFFEGLGQRTHQAWMRPVSDYVDDPFYRLFLWFKTDTVINWMNYSNPRIDEITDLLANELDVQRREELTKEAQQIINEDMPVLFVAEPNYMLAMRDDIKGFVLEPDGLLSYYELCR